MKQFVSLIVMMAIASVAAFAAQQAPGPESTPISLELRDTPIRTAIDSLFRGTGLNYAIEPGVTGTIPNLSLKNVTLDQALKTLTKAAGLTYRKDGQVYLISVKKTLELPPAVAAPATETASAVEEPAEVDRKVEKIQLNYADAVDIAGIFGAQAYSSRGAALAYSGGFNSGSGGYGSSYGGLGSGMSTFGSGFGNSSFGNFGSYGGFGSSYGSGYGSGHSGGRIGW